MNHKNGSTPATECFFSLAYGPGQILALPEARNAVRTIAADLACPIFGWREMIPFHTVAFWVDSA